MGMSNAERQRRWLEKNRAAFNLRRRNARKNNPVQEAEPIDRASAGHAIPGGRTVGSNPATGANTMKKEVKLDEDSGSMLCPECGGYEEHKDGCEGKPTDVQPMGDWNHIIDPNPKRKTIAELRKLIEEPRKASETLEEAPVIVETRSASDVARGVYRNDSGGIISKSVWEKLQGMKAHAKEKNFVIDEYSQ